MPMPMPMHKGLRPSLEPLLQQSLPGLHPGLWLDRYLSHTTFAKGAEPVDYKADEAKAARDRLVERVDHKPLGQGYKAAWTYWRDGLISDGLRTCVCEVESGGRVVIGIGQKNPAEFGITLHRTWGVPILPGSSLKGIAALGADRYFESPAWRRRGDHATARDGGPTAYDALFGDVEEQGAVIFHDAWYVPPASEKNGLHRDVLTVHHPGYYQQGNDGKAEPSDTESPIPVPFMSAKGAFLIALELHPSLDPATDGHWLKAAWEALRLGLSRHGVGSKTNAGYGRFELPDFDQTSTGKELKKLLEEAGRARTNAERAATRTPLDPAKRVAHVCADEGVDALVAWARSPSAAPIVGLPLDEVHVRAAAAAVYRAKKAKGVAVLLSAEVRPWWEAGLAEATAQPPGPVPTRPTRPTPDAVVDRRRLSDAELTERLAKYAKKADWNGFAHQIANERVDADTLKRAIALLSTQKGFKPGHAKVLQTELASVEGQ
jgi:CRISPR-associated protein Cmr6